MLTKRLEKLMKCFTQATQDCQQFLVYFIYTKEFIKNR